MESNVKPKSTTAEQPQLALPAPASPPTFLSIQEIATRWAMSEKHVRREIDQGRLNAHWFGDAGAERQRVRINRDELLEYEKKHRAS